MLYTAIDISLYTFPRSFHIFTPFLLLFVSRDRILRTESLFWSFVEYFFIFSLLAFIVWTRVECCCIVCLKKFKSWVDIIVLRLDMQVCSIPVQIGEALPKTAILRSTQLIGFAQRLQVVAVIRIMLSLRRAVTTTAPLAGRRGLRATAVSSRLYSQSVGPLVFDLHEPAQPKTDKRNSPILFLHGLFGSKKNNRAISK